MTALILALAITQAPVTPPNPEHNLPVVTSPVTNPSVPVIEQGKEVDWATGVFQSAKAAAGEKRWGLLVSILLMACLSLFSWLFIRVQELRDRLKQYMPEVAVTVSILGYVAVALGSLPVGAHVGDWWAVIWPAVKTGLAAVGAYELLVKRVVAVWLPKALELAKKLLAKKAPA